MVEWLNGWMGQKKEEKKKQKIKKRMRFKKKNAKLENERNKKN